MTYINSSSSSSSSSSSLKTSNEYLLELKPNLEKRLGYIWMAEEDNLVSNLISDRYEYLNKLSCSNQNVVKRIVYEVLRDLKTDCVKKCLQAKGNIILNKLQGKIITPQNQHLSIYLIFAHWVLEMVELYKVNFPDDPNIERIKADLLVLVASWRYNLGDSDKKKKLLDKLEELSNLLQNVYPDAQEFTSICSAFEELLTDNCETENNHWDPDIYPWSLINRNIPYGKMETKYVLNAVRVFSVSKNEFEKMWKYSCLVALEMWQTIIPIVESKRKITRKIMQIKSGSLSSEEQKIIKNTLDLDNSLKFIERWNKKIYHVLIRLEKSSLDNPYAIADEIADIKEVVTTVDKFSNFPLVTSKQENKAALREKLSSLGIDNPDTVMKLAELNSQQLNDCHMLMDIAANANLRKIVEYWEALCGDKKIVERDLKFNQEMEKARKAGNDLLKLDKEKKKKPAQRKKNRVVKSEAESEEKVIECKDVPKLPFSKPSVVKEQNIVLKGLHPFKSTLTKDSKDSIILKACEADLYVFFLDAANSLVEKYGDDELHSFNIHRLSHNTMQSTIELSLTYVNMLKDSDVDKFSHNLWTLFRKSKLQLKTSAVQELYLASFWTRFMREQHSQWSSLQARGYQMPKVLQELTAIADQPKGKDQASIQDSLKRRLVNVHNLVVDISDSLSSVEEPIGKFPELDKPLPKLPSIQSVEIASLDELMKKVDYLLVYQEENSNLQKYLLIRQWSDDLKCLRSTYKLIHSVTCPKQYAILVGNFHALLHAVVQSPLYAMQVSVKGTHELSHNLTEIWKSLDDNMPISVQKNLQDWLFNANFAGRYPFECLTPQSEMHRIQLEAISGVLAPELLDGFRIVQKQSGERSFDISGTWLPKLKECRLVEDQRKSLVTGLETISTLLLEQLLPLLTKQEVKIKLILNHK